MLHFTEIWNINLTKVVLEIKNALRLQKHVSLTKTSKTLISK